MRVALLYHPWQLGFRGPWSWADPGPYDDPRGMSGSELGFVEIAKELGRQGHRVHLFSQMGTHAFPFQGVSAHPWEELSKPSVWEGYDGPDFRWDLAIAINHMGGLEHFSCPKVGIQWLNSFEYLTVQEVNQVDLWLSPSETHKKFILSKVVHDLQDGKYTPSPEKWDVMPLGCDISQYYGQVTVEQLAKGERWPSKVPGRCIYASSPDRGLHHLLQVWPQIKAKDPRAHLRIFYRLQPWIDELKAAHEPYPPIEENRQRALYIEAALERLKDPNWGVEVVGPVSRQRMAEEMTLAEVLTYPCDTLRWSEGFSCTTLEACAAGAIPVIFDCDALGDVYRDSGAYVVERGNLQEFTEKVHWALGSPGVEVPASVTVDPNYRRGKTLGFARNYSWSNACSLLIEKSLGLTGRAASSTAAPTPSTTAEAASTT